MAYVLEKITDEIREKIFSDVKNDVLAKNIPLKSRHIHWFITELYEGAYISMPETWIVDHDKGFYLLRLEQNRGSPTYRGTYLFYYQGVCYEIRALDIFTQEVSVYDTYGPKLEELKPEFFEEFYMAYGAFLNSLDQEERKFMAVRPEFKRS